MCRPASSPIAPLQGSFSRPPPPSRKRPLLFVHSAAGNLYFSILASFPGLARSIIGLVLMVKPQLVRVSLRQLVPGRWEASTSTRLDILHVEELLANQMRIQARSYNPESQTRSCSIPEQQFLPLVLEIAKPLPACIWHYGRSSRYLQRRRGLRISRTPIP